jgi:hypothetical protein
MNSISELDVEAARLEAFVVGVGFVKTRLPLGGSIPRQRSQFFADGLVTQFGFRQNHQEFFSKLFDLVQLLVIDRFKVHVGLLSWTGCGCPDY